MSHEAGNPRSRHLQKLILGKGLLLPCKGPLSRCALTWKIERELMASSKPVNFLKVSIILGAGASRYQLAGGDTQASVHSTPLTLQWQKARRSSRMFFVENVCWISLLLPGGLPLSSFWETSSHTSSGGECDQATGNQSPAYCTSKLIVIDLRDRIHTENLNRGATRGFWLRLLMEREALSLPCPLSTGWWLTRLQQPSCHHGEGPF